MCQTSDTLAYVFNAIWIYFFYYYEYIFIAQDV